MPTGYGRLFLRGNQMTTEDTILQRVTGSLDVLLRLGEQFGGLFPSMIDRATRQMVADAPEPIPGQRGGDRSYRGSNLIHDEATLLTMYGLAEALNRPDYEVAADRYLERFATHCTATVSGLFPWGEHSYWDLERDCVGDGQWHRDPERRGQAVHDHLRAAPQWLWDKLSGFNPRCLETFAEGLDNHWSTNELASANELDSTRKPGEPLEYIRHGLIEQREYHPRGARSCDFPRHGGFFIVDWACAFRATGRQDFLEQIRRMVDYWWPKRDERDLLLLESRSPEEDERFYGTNAPGQTLSLAVSLLEAAPLLTDDEPQLAATMAERATAYIDGFLRAPHDLDQGIFVIHSKRDGNTVFEKMPVWGSVYGIWPASYVALTCLLGYRQTGDERLLSWARAAGERYAEEPIPAGVQAPAMDAGLGLGLLADLYDVTGEATWLCSAMTLAESLLKIYYPDVDGSRADLPVGAAGIDWYESQMGPGFLLHGLARTALLNRGPDACPLAADYTAR